MHSLLFYLYSIVLLNKLKSEVITDYTVNKCLRTDNENKLKYFYIDSDGFPLCENYNTLKKCDPANESKSFCDPGLKCSADTKTCSEVDQTSCFKYYANVVDNTNIMKLLWTPDCLQFGEWASVQCKGVSSERCFCYDENGNRIFGDSFNDNNINMNCACSRRKSELLARSPEDHISFHCNDQGNYEELQCNNGYCWCADIKNGELKSMIVPEKTMKFLDCAKETGNYLYLRKCETHSIAQSKIIDIMIRHGVAYPNIQKVSCVNDGSYGPYAIQNTNAYCVDKYNKKLGPYQTSISKISIMNCNCARDEALYAKSGKQFSLKCDLSGSYKPLQSRIENDIVENFCVDKDGNKKVDVSDDKAEDSYCNQFYD